MLGGVIDRTYLVFKVSFCMQNPNSVNYNIMNFQEDRSFTKQDIIFVFVFAVYCLSISEVLI